MNQYPVNKGKSMNKHTEGQRVEVEFPDGWKPGFTVTGL